MHSVGGNCILNETVLLQIKHLCAVGVDIHLNVWSLKRDHMKYSLDCSTGRLCVIHHLISVWRSTAESWWRHQMETFSALLALCEVNSHHKAELWYFLLSPPEQMVEWKIETPVIWGALALIVTSLQGTHHVTIYMMITKIMASPDINFYMRLTLNAWERWFRISTINVNPLKILLTNSIIKQWYG